MTALMSITRVFWLVFLNEVHHRIMKIINISEE